MCSLLIPKEAGKAEKVPKADRQHKLAQKTFFGDITSGGLSDLTFVL
jgi:hypothetical protein